MVITIHGGLRMGQVGIHAIGYLVQEICTIVAGQNRRYSPKKKKCC